MRFSGIHWLGVPLAGNTASPLYWHSCYHCEWCPLALLDLLTFTHVTIGTIVRTVTVVSTAIHAPGSHCSIAIEAIANTATNAINLHSYAYVAAAAAIIFSFGVISARWVQIMLMLPAALWSGIAEQGAPIHSDIHRLPHHVCCNIRYTICRIWFWGYGTFFGRTQKDQRSVSSTVGVPCNEFSVWNSAG